MWPQTLHPPILVSQVFSYFYLHIYFSGTLFLSKLFSWDNFPFARQTTFRVPFSVSFLVRNPEGFCLSKYIFIS
jgi:hypothetical protein